MSKKRLIIPKKGKKFLGVAVAFANYFEIDVTLVRLLWVLLFLPGGLPGLIPYLIAWVLIPNQGDDAASDKVK
jgi:phage shock protein C